MAFAAARYVGTSMRRSGPGMRQPFDLLIRRSGMGLPTHEHRPPTAPVEEENELNWDSGDGYTERIFTMAGGDGPFSRWECVAWLAGGLGMFGVVGFFAKVWNDHRKCPYPPKEAPWLDEWDGYDTATMYKK